MRFLSITCLLILLAAATACGGTAPNLATPARPPIAISSPAPAQPTSPAQPTAQPTAGGGGVVTATPEPANAEPTATTARGGATNTPAAETPIPVAPVQPASELVGSYGGILVTADGAGSIVQLELALDGTATLTTQSLKDQPSVETGTWTSEGDTAHVILTQKDGQSEDNRITWTLDGNKLDTTEFDETLYGTIGLPLVRVGTGDIIEANFGGVSFSFDSRLAQTAQGKFLPAVPVEEAPALGGGAPEGIQFTFDNEVLPDYFDPTKPQIYVYPVEGLKALDPSVKEDVEQLEQILADGTVPPDAKIPTFPLIPASPAFHAQTRILDFVNGTGVSYITYYTQDVSPILAERVFWTFQGITLDGKYYVSAYWNISSPVLPKGDGTISGADYDKFANQYTDYLNTIVAALNRMPPAGFNPNLNLLENMARSINANPQFPEVTPGPQPTSPGGETPQAETTPAAGGTAQPQATAPAGETPQSQSSAPTGSTTVDHNGTSFSFTSDVAKSAQGVTIPAKPVDPNVPGGLSMGGPEHTAFAFDGAEINSDVNPFQAQVRVYPAEELKDLDPAVAREVIALKTLLQVKPERLTDAVPVVPVFNAQQMLHPQLKYLPFKNGEGVRTVTFYAQNPSPMSNDGLFYTFQGLSSDGKYYVDAFFPVKTDKLPNTFADAGIQDFSAWMKNFSQYLADTDAMMNALPSDAFTPNLDSLDQLIESIQVPQ